MNVGMFLGDPGQHSSKDPLSRYRIFHTMDLDEARDLVAKIYAPHELGFAGRRSRQLDTSMSHFPIGGISLNRLRYGGEVNIDVECLGNFLLVMMPITGCAQIRCGTQTIRSTPHLASVITPTLPLQETIDANCDQVMVRIDRTILERICSQHLGHDLRQPLQFDLGLDLSDDRSNGWSALVSYLIAEIDNASPLLHSPLISAQIEHLVVSMLLLSQNHNYRSEFTQPAKALAPGHVKRVEEYIATHADQPLTVAELAAYAKVSTSNLYAGFRDFRNSTPMAYLKTVRLERVRHDLCRADQTTATVTDIASRWGFRHLGHFATSYKKMFGESPSETLRKAI
ncbi:MAG: AraC family transcriptional regulator [Proteobacteria bacterium]|nr:AraC family transcriptional regulator [Pseudomonadota bacterium]